MDRQPSDEQLDRIARNLLRDFAPDDETLDEIAESPRLWWSVRRRIEAERAQREKSWFGFLRPQILAYGLLLMLAGGGLAILFLNSAENSKPVVAEQRSVQNPTSENSEPANATPKNDSRTPEISKNRVTHPVAAKSALKNSQPKFIAKNERVDRTRRPSDNSPAREIAARAANAETKAETKTDFIALSYASATDSGQIVRVKVPSSMMVTLGVKSTVEEESETVDAEVVVGDDGLARAIRFIR